MTGVDGALARQFAMRVSCASLLAIVLLGWGSEASAQAAEGCVAPPPWSASAARPGHPDQEIAACLRSEAYKARTLHIPVDNVSNGIVASCEVEIDRIEGRFVFDDATAPKSQRQAVEQSVMRQATAAVTQYRSCAAR
jgi:hypothetical protein